MIGSDCSAIIGDYGVFAQFCMKLNALLLWFFVDKFPFLTHIRRFFLRETYANSDYWSWKCRTTVG